MSRNIKHLHPDLQPLAVQFQTNCAARWGRTNIAAIITGTWRSAAEQDALYAHGRTVPGPMCRCGGKFNPIGTCSTHKLGMIVTKAKSGQSKHEYTLPGGVPASLAFDAAILRDGKPIWGTKGDGIDLNPADDLTDDLELWQRLGEIGVDLGLVWFGSPDAPFKEFPHFQLKGATAIMARRG